MILLIISLNFIFSQLSPFDEINFSVPDQNTINKKRNFILRDSLKEVRNLIGKDAELLVDQNPYDVLNGNEISVEIDSVYSYKEKYNIWNKFLNKLF